VMNVKFNVFGGASRTTVTAGEETKHARSRDAAGC